MVLFFTLGTGRSEFYFYFPEHCPSVSFTLNLLLLKKLIQQIDETPLDGNVFDRESLEELSKEGVTLVSHLDIYYSCLDSKNLSCADSLYLTLGKR